MQIRYHPPSIVHRPMFTHLPLQTHLFLHLLPTLCAEHMRIWMKTVVMDDPDVDILTPPLTVEKSRPIPVLAVKTEGVAVLVPAVTAPPTRCRDEQWVHPTTCTSPFYAITEQ